VSNTLRSLTSVSDWFDPYRLKSKLRGKLPTFYSLNGSKPASRKVNLHNLIFEYTIPFFFCIYFVFASRILI
jgi:hypothetical protein